MTTAAEVRAWMAAHHRGYKAAAKHFGIPVAEVRDLCAPTGSKPRARAPAQDKPTPAIAKPPALDAIAAELEQAQRNLRNAEQADAWSAIAALTGRVQSLRKDLYEERARVAALESNPAHAATEDELIGEIIESVALVPEHRWPELREAVDDLTRQGLRIVHTA